MWALILATIGYTTATYLYQAQGLRMAVMDMMGWLKLTDCNCGVHTLDTDAVNALSDGKSCHVFNKHVFNTTDIGYSCWDTTVTESEVISNSCAEWSKWIGLGPVWGHGVSVWDSHLGTELVFMYVALLLLILHWRCATNELRFYPRSWLIPQFHTKKNTDSKIIKFLRGERGPMPCKLFLIDHFHTFNHHNSLVAMLKQWCSLTYINFGFSITCLMYLLAAFASANVTSYFYLLFVLCSVLINSYDYRWDRLLKSVSFMLVFVTLATYFALLVVNKENGSSLSGVYFPNEWVTITSAVGGAEAKECQLKNRWFVWDMKTTDAMVHVWVIIASVLLRKSCKHREVYRNDCNIEKVTQHICTITKKSSSETKNENILATSAKELQDAANCNALAEKVKELQWLFRGQPAPGATDAEIADWFNWFKQQPTAAAGSDWFRGQPAPGATDAEIADWFRQQPTATAVAGSLQKASPESLQEEITALLDDNSDDDNEQRRKYLKGAKIVMLKAALATMSPKVQIAALKALSSENQAAALEAMDTAALFAWLVNNAKALKPLPQSVQEDIKNKMDEHKNRIKQRFDALEKLIKSDALELPKSQCWSSPIEESGTLGDAVRALDLVPEEILAKDLELISASDDYGAF